MKVRKALLVVMLILLAMSQMACANKRFYIGMDDYGEPKEFKHEFTTRGNGDGARGSSQGKY